MLTLKSSTVQKMSYNLLHTAQASPVKVSIDSTLSTVGLTGENPTTATITSRPLNQSASPLNINQSQTHCALEGRARAHCVSQTHCKRDSNFGYSFFFFSFFFLSGDFFFSIKKTKTKKSPFCRAAAHSVLCLGPSLFFFASFFQFQMFEINSYFMIFLPYREKQG